MKNKKKIKKRIIILVVICIIILIVSFIIINLLKKEKADNISNDDIIIRGLDNKYPIGTFNFSKKYTGKMEMNKISTMVSNFMTSSIPTLTNLTKTYTESQLRDYYKNSYSTVRKLFGMISEEEFIDLANYLKSFKNENLTYETSEYLVDTYKEEEKFYTVKLKIIYSNEESIEITLKISKIYEIINFVVD